MESKDFCCYEFGEFKLDARRRALSKNGEKVPLPARNFDLLLFMVENGGRILEHDELLDKVWAGTFVEQATLKKGISALWQILAEKPESEYIKTIPRRGYSFVSPVRLVPEDHEMFFVRETEREILVEEYVETDEPEGDIHSSEKIIEIPAAAVKELAAAPKKSQLPRIALYGIGGLIILAAAFYLLKPNVVNSVRQQFSAENVRIARITNSGKVISGTAVSADGNYLLFPTAEKDGTVLWLRQVLANSATKLTPPTPGNFWAFGIAPDNNYVYYIFDNTEDSQKSGLYKMPLLGGEAQRLAVNVGSMVVAPDGKRIALVRGGETTGVSLINTDGEGEHQVLTLPADSRLWSVRWTPDGSALLCTIRKTVDNKPLYYVSEFVPENGAETVILPAQERILYGAEWLPDKSALLIVVREANADLRQIWQYFPAMQEWRRITNDSNTYKGINITRDGKCIISSQESRLSAIWLADMSAAAKSSADKKNPVIGRDSFRQITDGVSNFDRIGWLADGHLFYSATENGKETVMTASVDGTNARSITSGEDGIWLSPNMAGSGQSVGFLSSKSGTRQAWRVDADGKNALKMTETAAPIVSAKILRDNTTVLYVIQDKSGATYLYKQTADGQTVQLTEADTGFYTVTTDEKLLALEIVDKNTGKTHVEVRSMEDNKVLKTFEFAAARQITFTPDGKNLAYDARTGDVGQIMMQPLDGGAPYALTDFQSELVFSFDWSADGTQLAVIRGKQLDDAVLIKANER